MADNLSVLTAEGTVEIKTREINGIHYVVSALAAPEVELASEVVTWASSIAAGVAKTVNLTGMEEGLIPGRMLMVIIKNESTISDITGIVTVAYEDPDGGSTRYADISAPDGPAAFTVFKSPTSPEGAAHVIDGGLLAAGGRLTLTNNTALGGGQGFTASVVVKAIAGI